MWKGSNSSRFGGQIYDVGRLESAVRETEEAHPKIWTTCSWNANRHHPHNGTGSTSFANFVAKSWCDAFETVWRIGTRYSSIFNGRGSSNRFARQKFHTKSCEVKTTCCQRIKKYRIQMGYTYRRECDPCEHTPTQTWRICTWSSDHITNAIIFAQLHAKQKCQNWSRRIHTGQTRDKRCRRYGTNRPKS